MNVLIVDDSIVFRSQIKAALEGVAGISVVGVAANGKIALDKLAQLKVDLITLDLEMPGLSGIETLGEIRKRGLPIKVIVFSSLTQRGADAALQALKAGADDVVAKPQGAANSLNRAFEQIREELLPKIRQFAEKAPVSPAPKASPSPSGYRRVDITKSRPRCVLIGSSTGGPDALQNVFRGMGGPLPFPILLTQHMPPVFTASLARHLESVSGIPTAEAKQWETPVAGRIYIAPGDYHLTLVRSEGQIRLKLDQGPKIQSVRPAVDPLFQSAAEIFGADCVSFILTGMGEDGLAGCRAIKQAGGGVMIQNAESSVVFGMPGAVYRAGLYDAMGDLFEIRSMLDVLIKNSRGVGNTPLAA